MVQNKLIDKINNAADIISNANLKGTANCIIVSSEISEILDNLNIKRLRKKKVK